MLSIELNRYTILLGKEIMAKKLTFKSLVSLVVGSQVGSGVFLLPATLAALGPISLFGWLISGSGAILLALVFAQLSMRTSKGGGPHVYVEKAFGRKAAFYTAWTYWLVSWVSSIAVIVAAVGYLSPLLGQLDPWMMLALEMSIAISVTLINIRSTAFSGSVEFFLTILKCIPLIIIPFVALFFLKADYFFPLNPKNLDIGATLNTATSMTFWGFVGIETATVTAGIIDNPTKVIPKAVVLGTVIVVGIYLLNSFGVMGVVHPDLLSNSQAPYVDAAQVLFGYGGNIAIALVAFVACVGTLNAWVLTSGQIAVEAAKDGLFPPIFARTNRFGSPYVSLLIALFCTLPLLGLTLTPHILQQLNVVIDLSVTAFLFIYLACTFAFLKVLTEEKFKKNYRLWIISAGALAFCLWVISLTSWKNLGLCSLFVLSGWPIYKIRAARKKPVSS